MQAVFDVNARSTWRLRAPFETANAMRVQMRKLLLEFVDNSMVSRLVEGDAKVGRLALEVEQARQSRDAARDVLDDLFVDPIGDVETFTPKGQLDVSVLDGFTIHNVPATALVARFLRRCTLTWLDRLGAFTQCQLDGEQAFEQVQRLKQHSPPSFMTISTVLVAFLQFLLSFIPPVSYAVWSTLHRELVAITLRIEHVIPVHLQRSWKSLQETLKVHSSYFVDLSAVSEAERVQHQWCFEKNLRMPRHVEFELEEHDQGYERLLCERHHTFDVGGGGDCFFLALGHLLGSRPCHGGPDLDYSDMIPALKRRARLSDGAIQAAHNIRQEVCHYMEALEYPLRERLAYRAVFTLMEMPDLTRRDRRDINKKYGANTASVWTPPETYKAYRKRIDWLFLKYVEVMRRSLAARVNANDTVTFADDAVIHAAAHKYDVRINVVRLLRESDKSYTRATGAFYGSLESKQWITLVNCEHGHKLVAGARGNHYRPLVPTHTCDSSDSSDSSHFESIRPTKRMKRTSGDADTACYANAAFSVD